LLLQAAYSDYQIRAFENFHQLVEDTLIVLRPGPKVFFQYELRFVNCLKSQLLIGHLFLPIKIVDQSPLLTHQTNDAQTKERARNQANFGKYPRFFGLSPSIFVSMGRPSARDRGGFPVQTPLQASTHIGLDWRLLNPALRVSNLKYVLGP
jgi:hypothetical protein